MMKLLLFPLFLFAAIFWVCALLAHIPSMTFSDPHIRWFTLAAALAATYSFFSGRSTTRIALFHELTHILWAKLFSSKVVSLYVSESQGGYAQYRGGYPAGRIFITLAPYFFPLIPLFLLTIRTMVTHSYQIYFSGAIGFTLMIFYWDVLWTIMNPQSDIRQEGVLFSSVTIFCFNVFFLGIILFGLSSSLSIHNFIFENHFPRMLHLLPRKLSI